MNVWMIVIGVAMIIVSLLIIVVVLLQQSRRAGIGAISGGVDTFFSKNKARDMDGKISAWTKWIALIFFVLAIAASAVALLVK